MKYTETLCDLPIGEKATVKYISDRLTIRTRLMELGLIEGTEISCIGASPLGDPRAYMIRGAVIALRSDESKCIKIRSV